MAIPKILKNFNAFVDGRGLLGIATEVGLPKLALKTEGYRGAGMDAEVDIDMGMEKLEGNFTLDETNADTAQLFGLADASKVGMTFRGAQQGDDGQVEAVVCEMRGQIKELDPGTWKAGDKATNKFVMAVRYYKLTIGSTVVHEIDVIAGKRVIGGTDQTASIRSAIGA